MKSYPSVRPPTRKGARAKVPLTPTDAADIGTDDFGCYLCGAVFIRRATRAYILRAGDVYCNTCGVWSQAQPL